MLNETQGVSQGGFSVGRAEHVSCIGSQQDLLRPEPNKRFAPFFTCPSSTPRVQTLRFKQFPKTEHADISSLCALKVVVQKVQQSPAPVLFRHGY